MLTLISRNIFRKYIAGNNGYSKELVQKIYKRRRKALNSIQSGQKPKRNTTTAIPYCKGTAYILKKAAVKNW